MSRMLFAWCLIAGCMISGCAAGGDSRVARGGADCPPGFVLSCEANRRGNGTALSGCGCERHNDIEAMLNREW